MRLRAFLRFRARLPSHTHARGAPRPVRMFVTFARLKALNPSHTNIIYLNSMFNFAFYRLNGIIQAREAAGEQLLLRDMHGTLVQLCNDGVRLARPS